MRSHNPEQLEFEMRVRMLLAKRQREMRKYFRLAVCIATIPLVIDIIIAIIELNNR